MEPQELDQFTRRLLYAYHGHQPRANDNRLYCKACGIDFGTASIPDIMTATRRIGYLRGCPRCRRLERILLVATAYLSPSNWYESPETMKLLDRAKRHLPLRLQDILNRHLAPRVE
jgi:hypothetical protein